MGETDEKSNFNIQNCYKSAILDVITSTFIRVHALPRIPPREGYIGDSTEKLPKSTKKRHYRVTFLALSWKSSTFSTPFSFHSVIVE